MQKADNVDSVLVGRATERSSISSNDSRKIIQRGGKRRLDLLKENFFAKLELVFKNTKECFIMKSEDEGDVFQGLELEFRDTHMVEGLESFMRHCDQLRDKI